MAVDGARRVVGVFAMAGTAQRIGDELGTDTVRRLIARPIRTHLAQASIRRPASPLDVPVPPEALDAEAADAPEPEDEGVGTASPDVARLRAELLVLKAVVSAERREVASLRACIGLDAAEAGLGVEARAMRDRWAALVDRLIHESR